MKPAPFLYERPRTVEETVSLLREHGDEAKVLAGGQSLVPLLNLRLARPQVIVDINRVEGLDRREGSRVGATVRQRALSGIPLVDLAMPYVGHYVTRNRGTVGGSIAHADASAELPLCLLVLAGTVHTSAGRELPAEEFFVSHFTTILEPGELLVSTSWPKGGAVGFSEFALRRGDFALAACACSLELHEGTITGARVGVGAVVDHPTPLDLDLVGAPANAETAREAGARASTLVHPFGTQHVTAAYLRSLTGVVVERALEQAFERAAA
jgi:CO/xanthine dehydrogenase FAD-binding subunit